MFLRGINYDVGTSFIKGQLTRPDFDEDVVKKEIAIIKNDLHCDCIKITGHDIGRLSKASEFALEQGLQVWLMPSYIDATGEEAVSHLVDCAKAAESLRAKYNELIFVTGFEYSLFLKGFVKGETIYQRLGNMFNPLNMILNALGLKKNRYKQLNKFLSDAARKIREQFNGQVTYASGTWEKIDWTPFDFVGIDHYRSNYNKSGYSNELRAYYKFNKPVVIMEFGCCAYQGAAEKGPMGWAITEAVDGRSVIKGNPVRDESVQADYITGLLDVFKQEQVYAAFIFTFVNPVNKYDANPRFDLDMASYGIVKPVDDAGDDAYKGMPWVPKQAFHQLAKYYGEL